MATLEIELPLPDRALSSNARMHWRKKSPITKGARALAQVSARMRLLGYIYGSSHWAAGVPVRIDHEWFMGRDGSGRDYHPRDVQNAISSLKAYLDGLVDAGVMPDDTYKWVKWGECTFHNTQKEHRGRSCVVLRITTIET